ncbi:MAG: hypothetical protein AB3N11_16450 [Arenibacterium sp.]
MVSKLIGAHRLCFEVLALTDQMGIRHCVLVPGAIERYTVRDPNPVINNAWDISI